MKKLCFLSLAALLLIPAMIASGEPRKVLKVGVQMFGKVFDPAAEYNNRSALYHINLHDGLVRLSSMEIPHKVLPAIATSWEEIFPTVTEFKLRQGAKFWDGTLITAEGDLLAGRHGSPLGQLHTLRDAISGSKSVLSQSIY